MRFSIHIDTDNAAFHDGESACAQEVARILDTLSERLRENGILEGMLLRDYNGNTVGMTRIDEES